MAAQPELQQSSRASKATQIDASSWRLPAYQSVSVASLACEIVLRGVLGCLSQGLNGTRLRLWWKVWGRSI